MKQGAHIVNEKLGLSIEKKNIKEWAAKMMGMFAGTSTCSKIKYLQKILSMKLETQNDNKITWFNIFIQHKS